VKLLTVVLSTIVGLTLVAGSASTTGSEPGASAASASPEASACRVAPRPRANFETLRGTPGVLSAMLNGMPPATPAPPSAGVPADERTVAGITATLETFVACTNAGDLPRVAALLSDDYYRRFFGGIDLPGIEQLFATPAPLPEAMRARIVSIDDVRILDDGRVSAVVNLNGKPTLAVFVDGEGRYLLDASYPLPVAGTPAP
jgi:hypothetical protein